MRFDFLTSNSWELANDRARAHFTGVATEPPVEARCYHGLAAGLLEVFSGTASFLSHRRTLGVVTGQSWVQDAVLPHLLRENFQIKYFAIEDLKTPDGVLAQLEGETSCFLWPEDHPVTGELFDGERLEDELAKKRIFSIRLSHHAFRTRPLKLKPYTVRLCSVRAELAVALLGARFKTPAWIAPWSAWNPEQVDAWIQEALRGAREDQSLVADFERQANAGWAPVLKTDSRLWDRALLWHSEISGDQALHELGARLGISPGHPGAAGMSETLHLCRWDATIKDLEWWKNHPSPDAIRGLIALDVSLLTDAKVREYFRAGPV